jgi:hypothetical protein
VRVWRSDPQNISKPISLHGEAFAPGILHLGNRTLSRPTCCIASLYCELRSVLKRDGPRPMAIPGNALAQEFSRGSSAFKHAIGSGEFISPLCAASLQSTWSQKLNLALFPSRVATVSLGVLGVMGAMLSITGIFGLAAYSVSKRLKELGIRMALGAQRKEVLQAALGRAFKLLAFGSAAGLLLGILASRVLAFIVYQATPRDPLVLAGVVVAMFLLGLLGYLDSSAARAVDRSSDTAARGVKSALQRTLSSDASARQRASRTILWKEGPDRRQGAERR